MKYTVVFEPDEGGWHTYIPQVQGCRTWGRTLEAARRHIREALECALWPTPEDESAKIASEAEFVEDVRLPTPARKALDKARQMRIVADREAALALASTQAAAAALRDLGLSLRDAGELLGLSHQRVKQITEERAPKRVTPRRAARTAKAIKRATCISPATWQSAPPDKRLEPEIQRAAARAGKGSKA